MFLTKLVSYFILDNENKALETPFIFSNLRVIWNGDNYFIDTNFAVPSVKYLNVFKLNEGIPPLFHHHIYFIICNSCFLFWLNIFLRNH